MNKKEILNNDNAFKYQLLGRLERDCQYFLGSGNGNIKHLWSDTVEEHIETMKLLYNSFKDEDKPNWLTYRDILVYEYKMMNKNQ